LSKCLLFSVLKQVWYALYNSVTANLLQSYTKIYSCPIPTIFMGKNFLKKNNRKYVLKLVRHESLITQLLIDTLLLSNETYLGVENLVNRTSWRNCYNQLQWGQIKKWKFTCFS